jgi:hypothetical protein
MNDQQDMAPSTRVEDLEEAEPAVTANSLWQPGVARSLSKEIAAFAIENNRGEHMDAFLDVARSLAHFANLVDD